jgi:hypothetical protein
VLHCDPQSEGRARRAGQVRGQTVSLRIQHRLTTGVLLAAVGVVSLGSVVGAPVGASSKTTVRAALPPGKINHIIVVEFENESYEATFGPNSPATYLNGTLRKQG